MKTILIYLLTFAFYAGSFAQSNNPYNDIGTKYFESVDKIVNDIKANGFKGNDQKSLDYYAGLSSLQLKMNPDLATKIYEIRNSKNLNIQDFIKNSTLSEQSKDFTLRIVANLSKLTKDAKLKYFENLSREVKNSKLQENEKSLNLMLISIGNSTYQNRSTGKEKGCDIETANGVEHAEPEQCVLMGVALGAYIGFEICGPLCSVGGAIIVGVIVAISVC